MLKHRVTVVALGGLVAAAIAAYALNRGGAAVAPGADTKAAEVRSAAAGKSADKAAGGPPGGGAAPVEVVVLQPARISEELQAVGSLRSNESVMLRPEVSGRIATIAFRDGQPVKRGQLLVALDSSLNQAEVAQARAELDLAISNLKRTEDLARKNFVSSSAQEQAASNVDVLAAKLKLAEARLAKMLILAPFDGVVGIRSVSLGDYVREGTDLVNVEDIHILKVDFRLPERYFTQLKVGQAVEVFADALPGARYAGTVEAINPRIDASGRSLEVRARLANTDGRLRPGMFARVRVIVGERVNALLVPEEAIVPLGDDFFVYTVADGKANRVRVKLGVRRESQVELLEGVKPGDRVVTAGMRVQRDGQPVRVVNK
ncbi:MAG: efflux RND transporter periplasmic adaptor subunit [Burkholderiaceae bacterium]|nr:efflux RND transporter periplasmic adaptor subunit [Burkholderiaceae bacterium]